MSLAALAGCNPQAITLQGGADGAQSSRRTDQFQAAASNGKHVVAVRYGGVAVADLTGKSTTRIDLPGAPALIDIAVCPNGVFAALDFDRKVWAADASASNWKPQPIQGKFRPLALTCDPRNNFWVVGSDTTIAKSADQGATWSSQSLKKDAMLNTVQFVDEQLGYITGEFGMVLQSRDGGTTWNADAKIPDDFYPYAALFVSATQGYVTGLAGAILKTQDAGKTWRKTENLSGLPQFGLAKLGESIYSVGVGGSWQRLVDNRWEVADYSPRAPSYLRAITPLGADGMLIAGGAGALHRVSTVAAKKSP